MLLVGWCRVHQDKLQAGWHTSLHSYMAILADSWLPCSQLDAPLQLPAPAP